MSQEYMISIGDAISGRAEFHSPFAALYKAGINVIATASAFRPFQRGKVQNIAIVVAEGSAISEVVENAFDSWDLEWKGPRKVRTTVLRDEAGSLALFMNRLNDDLVDERGNADAYDGFSSLYILKTDKKGIHIGYTLNGDYNDDFVIH